MQVWFRTLKIVVVGLLFSGAMAFAGPAPAGFAAPTGGGGSPAATGTSEVCDAIGSGTDCNTTGTGRVDVNRIVKLVINLLSGVVGLVAVIMLIMSGFKYVTSGGDSNKVASAKNTLMYALIGVAIVALAQVIVRFVLGKVTS